MGTDNSPARDKEQRAVEVREMRGRVREDLEVQRLRNGDCNEARPEQCCNLLRLCHLTLCSPASAPLQFRRTGTGSILQFPVGLVYCTRMWSVRGRWAGDVRDERRLGPASEGHSLVPVLFSASSAEGQT